MAEFPMLSFEEILIQANEIMTPFRAQLHPYQAARPIPLVKVTSAMYSKKLKEVRDFVARGNALKGNVEGLGELDPCMVALAILDEKYGDGDDGLLLNLQNYTFREDDGEDNFSECNAIINELLELGGNKFYEQLSLLTEEEQENIKKYFRR